MKENRIIEIKLTLTEDQTWLVQVRKLFSEENGGGEQTFTENAGGSIHRALDLARELVTVSPARRTEITYRKVTA